MDHNNILSVVLAGGKSKRFGEDKSQVKLGKKLLIDHILSELINEFNEVLIVTNNPIKHLSSNKITKISDIKHDLGPLGGIFSAMKWVKDNNKSYKWIASFPADTPLFKIQIFKTFLETFFLFKISLKSVHCFSILNLTSSNKCSPTSINLLTSSIFFSFIFLDNKLTDA